VAIRRTGGAAGEGADTRAAVAAVVEAVAAAGVEAVAHGGKLGAESLVTEGASI